MTTFTKVNQVCSGLKNTQAAKWCFREKLNHVSVNTVLNLMASLVQLCPCQFAVSSGVYREQLVLYSHKAYHSTCQKQDFELPPCRRITLCQAVNRVVMIAGGEGRPLVLQLHLNLFKLTSLRFLKFKCGMIRGQHIVLVL